MIITCFLSPASFFTDILYPAGIYLFKVDHENTRKMCEVCSNLIIKTPERYQKRLSDIFIANFEKISLIVPVIHY